MLGEGLNMLCGTVHQGCFRRSAKAVFMAASTRDVPGTLFWGRRRHGGSCLASLAMLSGGRLRV
eukprot:scaffold118846_cov12-Tisochrysis_lutea.AAC.1